MPRKMRIEYPVAIYHVMSRGDRREDIYLADERRGIGADGERQCIEEEAPDAKRPSQSRN